MPRSKLWFRAALGVAHLPGAEALLRQIHGNEPLREEDLNPAMFDLPEGSTARDACATLEALGRLGCLERWKEDQVIVEPLVRRTFLG